MQGKVRKLVYMGLYEAIAVVLAGIGLTLLSGQGPAHAGGLAVVTSAIAMGWNLVFSHFFERWESRQPVRGRSLGRRVVHAIGFEGGLVAMLVPTIALWFGVSLWEALVMDLSLVVFFLVYTFVFSWAFDRVFGLPLSAQPA